MFLARFMFKRKNKKEAVLRQYWDVMTYLLYFSYDINKDFMEQLEFNTKLLKELLTTQSPDKLADMLFAKFGNGRINGNE